ncbi:hypothetical protein WJ038_03315 [Vibrio parahaemolyticus]|uniref:hypothetical protein n=2 Tax=Vibrio parahaemolyticus TaxID=670 RepID=UPI0004004C29|nr:hypothetical protein [Vibrio parahaemolyticus]AMG05408.1 hypothetical protein AL464_00460 [Vibrio parahaemolyticus]EGR0426916.1 hypothetical protein [Vibrio parahaemolyticus]KKI08078.1 hypothetical protein WU75_17660 [Vibrio parahaemolyticus]MBY7690527.1 hypothetical protein [Vibrio parahaemolyticus]OOE25888.1 hypothetical protein BS100_20090 [Vibrio parahaemolyticus]
MLNKMTLIAAATLALYGCGGGSSSGSTNPNKGPQESFDIAIQNSIFAPETNTQLSYSFSLDGQSEGDMKLSFQAMDSEQILAALAQIPNSEAIIQLVNDLVNYGAQQFYYSDKQFNNEEESNTLYFAGSDGALHEITDVYSIGNQFIAMLMHSSPIFRLNGNDVKEKSPNIDIGEETMSLQTTLTGNAVHHLLDSFEEHEWVQNLPMTASCQVVWQQQIRETGVRKTFSISGKTIEAAYLTEENTYNLNCDDMDSMEFATSAERWFNPSLGLIEQVELLKVQQVQINEENVQLTAIETK